jgi:hypothetical protein
MFAKLEYDGLVKGLKRLAVAGLMLVALGVLVPAAEGQINAAPPSVTSLGFGGRAINGTPPSVTSLGPRGYTPGFNPAFPNSRPVFGAFPTQPLDGHHHHHHNGFFPWGGAVYAVPYYLYYDTGDQAEDEDSREQYNGGPTVFDRRGPGRAARPPEQAYEEREPDREPGQASSEPVPSAAVPARDEPETVLVFKDGHQLEVENYAIVGNTLYDLTVGHRRRISLSDLDLDATTEQNDNRGIDFQVPSGS